MDWNQNAKNWPLFTTDHSPYSLFLAATILPGSVFHAALAL